MSFTVLPKRGLSRAQVEAEIDARLVLDFWETFDGRLAASNGTVAANTLYLTEVLEISNETSEVAHGHDTATGNAMHGIYTFDGTTFTRRAVTASTALAGSSVAQSIALTAAFTRIDDVRHFAAFITDSTGTFRRTGAIAGINGKNGRSFQYSVGSVSLPALVALGDVSASAVTLWMFGE